MVLGVHSPICIVSAYKGSCIHDYQFNKFPLGIYDLLNCLGALRYQDTHGALKDLLQNLNRDDFKPFMPKRVLSETPPIEFPSVSEGYSKGL